MSQPAEAIEAGKALRTLQARAALLGAVVEASDDDRGRPVYVVSCGALCERFDSMGAVEERLHRLCLVGDLA